jgi:hypothetical protein
MPSPEDQQPKPQPQAGEAADIDPTLGAINEVAATLGGTATSGAEVGVTMPDTPTGRLLEEALSRPPSEALRRQVRALRRKAYFMHGFIEEGAEPAGRNAGAIRNALIFSEAGQSPEMDRVLAETRNYLFKSGQVDIFEMQQHADRLVQTLIRNAGTIDMADLPLLCRQTVLLENDMLQGVSDAASKRSAEYLRQFDSAVVASVVHAVDAQHLLGDAIMPVEEMHQQVFGYPSEHIEHSRLVLAQRLIRDRLTISEMVVGASMYPEMPVGGQVFEGTSPYAPQLSPKEADELNAAAADTMERLHLLRRFGVAPFEVDGETLGLPWDVAVTPPLAVKADGTPEYAEGAVADYLFLLPTEHTDIQLQMTKTDSGVTIVKPGDAQAMMRFRLHDDGTISHGLGYHNTPGNLTQQTFEENGCGSAFQRLRGILIGLAFDAVVPDPVLRGPEVQTSVAEQLRRRPLSQEHATRRIADLLLRRRRALQTAGVRQGHSKPKGEEWQGPTRPVEGYRRRLPEGTRRRPEAEREAHEYYSSLGIEFNGLEEGENFVKGHDRRMDTEVQYRRAKFRRDSQTRQFMQSLAPERPAQAPRHRSQADKLREALRGVDPAIVEQVLRGTIDPATLSRLMQMTRGSAPRDRRR